MTTAPEGAVNPDDDSAHAGGRREVGGRVAYYSSPTEASAVWLLDVSGAAALLHLKRSALLAGVKAGMVPGPLWGLPADRGLWRKSDLLRWLAEARGGQESRCLV